MAKDILIHQIIEVLERAGFMVSNQCNIRPRSFDLAARQGNTLLFCKVLYNIDGLNEETAREMKSLAKYLNGYPILIGAKTRDQLLEDSVVYMRYDIPALSIQTLYDYFVENVPPLVSAAPGGLYVSIDGDVLKEARMNVSMSLGALASELGVSRRTISKYEEGQMDASIDIVLHLEEILDMALAKSIDILRSFEKELDPANVKEEAHEMKTPPNDNILNLIYTLGYDVLSTNQAPFKAVSKDTSSTFLTGVSEYSNAMVKRAHLMSSISNVIETQSVFIIEGKSRYKFVEDTVLIERDELNTIADSDDLDTLIHERAKRHKEE
ncbi:transcriptional regulator [Methanococcoides burtonii]|uniref:Putative HTH-type transcriptional regulatory protein Mbur_1811 n=1 Tax=Methanococcoides burtonii (strain DSM 6242 / NBRC 107633 / OCM 468 / ACE-M) TaxID=259564 RepID=Y1811_METBU|nr:transcriptional regulator [Methanococcoides burtonii]Q12V29.1 RecName: Full=Putative HTH-type transcriptional regulatory protein Mbur_1811 [Methanococcoides burtonii DSM 6242]ABE52697.1 HTH DNA-binding domain protein [Methanococcoides burtonii DSM 6242]